jgi:hypothetical protein
MRRTRSFQSDTNYLSFQSVRPANFCNHLIVLQPQGPPLDVSQCATLLAHERLVAFCAAEGHADVWGSEVARSTGKKHWLCLVTPKLYRGVGGTELVSALQSGSVAVESVVSASYAAPVVACSAHGSGL